MRTSIIEKLCFFCGCGKSAEESSWHQCQTLFLHKKVKTIAIELPEHKLLAKLSKGDMVATEAIYHLKYLNEVYNKYWCFCKQVSGKMKAISLKVHRTIFNNIGIIGNTKKTSLVVFNNFLWFFIIFLSFYINEMIHKAFGRLPILG